MDDSFASQSLMIPQGHSGIDYRVFTAALSRKRNSKFYLEIGVENGIHLSGIATERAIAIDPDFRINTNVIAGKQSLEAYQLSSDTFFEQIPSYALRIGKLDLAFLDGMHLFEFLLRDFYNVEQHASDNGLIMMHDCLPLNAEMADRNHGRSIERGRTTRFPDHWTGDVWKIVPILKKYRPDLNIVPVDCAPTGLICVTGLNPNSRVLKENYLEIVDEFKRLPDDEQTISRMYAEITLQPAWEILDGFDHSLYFYV